MRRSPYTDLQKLDRTLWIGLVKALKAAVLVFLLVQTLFLDLFPISGEPTLLRNLGTGLFFAGLCIAISGRIQLGDNWVDLEAYQVLPKQSVVSHGLYRYIRHPIYTGDLLLLLGLQLALNSWLVLGCALVFVVVLRQASAEEKLLAEAFPPYKEYCKQTKRFIPFLV